ncbi:MAG: C45 family autoproteolytic acyltransferase/hydrolase [Planctomycetota bacterium]|nr:C45 family autoproteolytic acyltransferase/hydrolase [Planctomycetota bacterium]
MSHDKLSITSLRGSPRACGRSYGEAFEPLIMGFARMEVKPDKRRLAFARRCWGAVERHAPTSAQFLRGAAEGAHLSLEQMVLLSLHEEIFHEQTHCTAFAARAGATRDGKTILAQNWDWLSSLYPWAGLLRLDMNGSPRVATYHYPGLWACAGINERGLGLVWTGGGYFPKVPSVVGVPTYVLIAEILRLSSVEEALAYLMPLRHAGCFIFFLGDATGATAVVEAVPGKKVAERSGEAITRANHYRCGEVLACGKQVRPPKGKSTTLQREARINQLMAEHEGRITPAIARRILTDRHGPWPWIHAFPGGRDEQTLGGMTIDSLFTVSEDRVLWTCRGGRVPGPWQSVTP